MTVCADINCIEKKYVNGVEKIHYKTICHNPCYLDSSDDNIIGNTGLLKCNAFNKYNYVGEFRWYMEDEGTWHPDSNMSQNENGVIWAAPAEREKLETCSKCSHSFKSHLHISYSTSLERREIRDETKYQEITNREEAIRALEEKINELKARIAQLRYERDEITKHTAKFACFLRNEAIAPFNDAFGDYVKFMIKNEKSSLSLGTGSKQRAESLKSLLKAYVEEKSILQNHINENESYKKHITAKSIEEAIEDLCKLKIYGRIIKKIFRDGERIKDDCTLTPFRNKA